MDLIDRLVNGIMREDRYCVIDVGSNSVRLLKAKIIDGVIVGSKSLIVTRLADMDEGNRLTKRAIDDTVEAIKAYVKQSLEFGAKKTFIMATSAVRDANNKAELIDSIMRETSLELDVLSGEQEAVAGCIGVKHGLFGSAINGKIGIIDIGGGSTEFIVYDKEIEYIKSINLGAVRMTKNHIDTNSIMGINGVDCSNQIVKMIESTIRDIKSIGIDYLIGIGGTITSFGAMDLKMEEYDRDKIHNYKISLDKVKSLNSNLQNLDLERRKRIAGLSPKRADIIVAGGLILEEIMRSLSEETVIISDYDNLEGYLLKKITNKY